MSRLSRVGERVGQTFLSVPAQTGMSAPHGKRVLAVALPTDSVALPDGLAEVRELRGVYGATTELAAQHATFPAFLAAAREADVIHVAGHTRRAPGEGDPALLFAGRRVTWSAVAAAPLARKPVVVLAACETLRTPQAPRAFAMSLGGGFLAAGAGDVIGTLAVVPDNDARELFRDVHRALAAGAGAAEAVRDAQLAALRGQRRTAWRAVTVLTRQIPRIGT